jgi:hypothetical protein
MPVTDAVIRDKYLVRLDIGEWSKLGAGKIIQDVAGRLLVPFDNKIGLLGAIQQGNNYRGESSAPDLLHSPTTA